MARMGWSVHLRAHHLQLKAPRDTKREGERKMRSSSLHSVFPKFWLFWGHLGKAMLTKSPSSEVEHLKHLFITHTTSKSSLHYHIATSIQYNSQERNL